MHFRKSAHLRNKRSETRYVQDALPGEPAATLLMVPSVVFVAVVPRTARTRRPESPQNTTERRGLLSPGHSTSATALQRPCRVDHSSDLQHKRLN